MKKNKINLIAVALFFCAIFLTGIFGSAEQVLQKENTFSFVQGKSFEDNIKQILNEDTISVLLCPNATDCFFYQGTPLGFQYDLLKEMASSLKKKIVFTINNDKEEVKKECFTNKFDIIAIDNDKNSLLDYYLTFSEVHSSSFPILIAKKTANKQTPSQMIDICISQESKIDLTSFVLFEDKKWNVTKQNSSIEELFKKVSQGEEQYLICYAHEAVTMLAYYDDLTTVEQFGEELQRKWILRNSNVALNKEINNWLTKYKRDKKYKQLCQKYFSVKSPAIVRSFGKAKSTTISPFDDIIKKYALKYQIDWRLVAAIICQESKFKTNVEGNRGSFGIMQLMPSTASVYSVDTSSSVEAQIAAGIHYLADLDKKYGFIKDPSERMKFVVGSYNSGPGHIQDAVRLCKQFNTDPNQWENVAVYLALKNSPDYYKHDVVYHGYYLGKHTVKYVNKVMNRYKFYASVIQ
ncbi:MAG: transglycosylase SLT domain-containing protein [Bacteroidales bacterium]|nr:transglycosylase SLT domain-containing protein [Bacteroidales bacterium]